MAAPPAAWKVPRNWISGYYFQICEYWEVEQATNVPLWRLYYIYMVVIKLGVEDGQLWGG